MTYWLLVTISTDSSKVDTYSPTVFLSKAACVADAAALRPKHLRLGDRIFEGIKAVCMHFDPKDVMGFEKAWLRPAATDTPRIATSLRGQSDARVLRSPGGARLIEE